MKREKCIATGKRRYPTEQDAIDVIKGARKRRYGETRIIPTRYYECDHCRGYHLSSKASGPGVLVEKQEEFKKFLLARSDTDERSVATEAQ